MKRKAIIIKEKREKRKEKKRKRHKLRFIHRFCPFFFCNEQISVVVVEHWKSKI